MQLHRVRDHMTQVQLHLLAPEFFLLWLIYCQVSLWFFFYEGSQLFRIIIEHKIEALILHNDFTFKQINIIQLGLFWTPFDFELIVLFMVEHTILFFHHDFVLTLF